MLSVFAAFCLGCSYVIKNEIRREREQVREKERER